MFDETLTINGFDIRARYTQSTLERVFMPLCERLCALHAQTGRPAIAILAAPPGAGKSTLAHALGMYAHAAGLTDIVPLGMDGFHYPNVYLREHTSPDGTLLADIKGAPPTYDIEKLCSALGDLKSGICQWPVYDRRLHDPAPTPLRVSGDIFIVEGNWLLLDMPRWRNIAQSCALTIAIDADEDMLMPRLIARKVRGGMAEDAARAFCVKSDLKNIRLFKQKLLPADIVLKEACVDEAIELTPLCGI